MVSQAELLNLAEAFAARIPRTPPYTLDWSAAWRAVASARLRRDDIAGAQRALNNVDELCLQAQLRVEVGLWVGRHPESALGREVLRDTISRVSAFERWWSRRDVSGLALVVGRVLGVEQVEAMARQLEDPFTAANVHVAVAYTLTDPSAQRDQLKKAEALAALVREGDRDFAIRSIFEGYRHAGLIEDAQQLRRLATKDPDDLTREERAIFSDADSILAKADTITERDPPDTLRDRLDRFIDYGFNDLKVLFLTDASRTGDLDNPEIEARLRSDLFQRIGPPRAPRLRSDMASLDAQGLASHLFARPVCQREEDKALLEGDDDCSDEHDPAAFLRLVTELFVNFGTIATPFSREQIEQGLWFVLGHPFWLHEALVDRRLPLDARERCVRAMIYPFRHYYLTIEAPVTEDVFFMWWDLVLTGAADHPSDLDAVAVEVIGEILRLPAKRCHFAALHGLNHLHPNHAAAELARRFLAEQKMSLTADEIAWAEACASGRAL